MPFLNNPIKVLVTQASSETGTVVGLETLPWYNPSSFPLAPGASSPAPVQRFYRWRITLTVTAQQHSSYVTRQPGFYNGYDVKVGDWIANGITGQCWQIITVESAQLNNVTLVVQDVFRYNTFRDSSRNGNGAPDSGKPYIIFKLDGSGMPDIDPVPIAEVSASFAPNINSRFNYINLQNDYPLYQENNTFAVNNLIAVDQVNHKYVLSDSTNKIVIGRVTSVSDVIPGWFTINPVNKIIDFLDSLPGDVGDTVYSSTETPGALTLTDTGTPVYIKLRNQTATQVVSSGSGPTAPTYSININGVAISIGGTGSAADLVLAINTVTGTTGVTAETALSDNIIKTDLANTALGAVILDLTGTVKPSASINGTTIVFSSNVDGYAQVPEIVTDINNANITNIKAAAVESNSKIQLTNSTGGPITIVNLNEGNGDYHAPFAGPASATGLPLNTASTTNSVVKLTAVDSRPINIVDIVGTTVQDFGLYSAENGTKAAGLYIQGGLRSSTSNNPASITVVTNISALNALTPLVGDQAYVMDSDDGNGNNVGNWSMWIYDGSQWVVVTTQDSATSSAKTIKSDIAFNSPVTTTMSSIPSKSRVTLVTVEVTTPFTGTPTMTIGYKVLNTAGAVVSNDGLMTSDLIDLNVAGTYTTSTNVLFGTTTVDGDVELLVKYTATGATAGAARVIISYV